MAGSHGRDRFPKAGVEPATLGEADVAAERSQGRQHSWDPQLNAAHHSCASCGGTFIGDYFSNVIDTDNKDHVATVTTYNDGTNPKNRQQQLVANLKAP